LDKVLSQEFNASIITASSITQIPPQLFDKQRKERESNDILQWLSNQYNADKSATKIVSICDFDAYSDNLYFVFGESSIGGNIPAIYLPRLRQEFYGLKPDESILYQRIVKEPVHELDHAFGLNPCAYT
jgi:archaemetzincin